MSFSAGSLLRACRQAVYVNRQLSVTPAVYKAAAVTDPIQQLFVEQVRLYAQKSKYVCGVFVALLYFVYLCFTCKMMLLLQDKGSLEARLLQCLPSPNMIMKSSRQMSSV